MKPFKVYFLLPLLTIIFVLVLSGCYTQLAFVDEDSNTTVDSPPTIIYQPEIVIEYIPEPVYNSPSPVYHPLPSAGSSQTVTQPQPQQQIRDSGYHRTSQSDNTQAPSSGSNARISGSRHGG